MQQIAVLSGKGGTGKTSITSAIGSLAKNSVFVDCDVDAADLYIIFQPENHKYYDFEGGAVAKVNLNKCNNCGRCSYSCRFDAIQESNGKIAVNEIRCEGCRVCMNICPMQAIKMVTNKNNKWFVGSSRFGELVHARLAPGEDNSGKLVSRIREEALTIARKKNNDYIILDGPPGIGCPVISTLSGVDKVLIITEPSVSGIHDLKRLVELIKKLDKKAYVAVNKFDLNIDKTNEIANFCIENGLELVEKIPFDHIFTEAMIEKKNIIEYAPHSEISKKISHIWEYIK